MAAREDKLQHPSYAAAILKIKSLRDKLRDKLHSVTAP